MLVATRTSGTRRRPPPLDDEADGLEGGDVWITNKIAKTKGPPGLLPSTERSRII
jgi:hypothetical protein